MVFRLLLFGLVALVSLEMGSVWPVVVVGVVLLAVSPVQSSLERQSRAGGKEPYPWWVVVLFVLAIAPFYYVILTGWGG